FDLDASALLVGSDGRVLSEGHFVFFNNLTSPEGAVRHGGDNRTGGDADTEVIHVDLARVPEACSRIVFVVSIYDQSQSFGQVRQAYIRVVDEDAGAELARYDLSEDAGVETAMLFGELYRAAPAGGATGWKFRAIGQGYANGLAGIAEDFGVQVG
ncbi:MAG TPA: TerD family protein, partial [Candidatus Dormibacteraeota bacterium]|nr:TerD family protein [Candidatus Dormibacteraeota bacterium]